MPSSCEPAVAPGAIVVVLRRRPTSTEVLLLGTGDAPFPCQGARTGTSQWDLAESLLRESLPEGVDRLYASALSVERPEGSFGVFVGFQARSASDAALPPGARWVDLRGACDALDAVWARPLAAVRERFVARPPDEALRVR